MFCNGCHILSLITVDRNVICSAELIVAPPVLHLLIMQPPANFLPTPQLPPETALARLTMTLSTTLVPFSSSSPSSATPTQPSQIVAHPHESLASQSLQRAARIRLSPWPHQYQTRLLPPSQSSCILSFILSDFNISPSTKSLTGKRQLQNRSLQDLLEMPCKHLGKKVTIMLGDIGDARTRWMVDILLTTADWIDLCRRPSLFAIRLAMLNTPVHLSLAADTIL